MLSIIGLALDLVGAGTLAIGLFRHAEARGFEGIDRTPEEAAADQAYGAAGFLLLASGFTLQALGRFGVHWSESPICTKLIVGACALLGAAFLALLVWGVVFRWRFPREIQRIGRQGRTIHSVRWKWRGFSLWQYEVGDEVDE